MPGRRPTNDEQAERIEFCRERLLRHLPKFSMKKQFRERFGEEIAANTFEGYLGRARQQLLAELARTKEDMRASSLAFYQSVIGDDTTVRKDQIKAQERIDKLLGLEAPAEQNINVKGQTTAVIEYEATDDDGAGRGQEPATQPGATGVPPE